MKENMLKIKQLCIGIKGTILVSEICSLIRRMGLCASIIMVVFLCGACNESESVQGEIRLYYLNKSEDSLIAEEYILESESKIDSVREIIYAMKNPREEYRLKPIISKDLKLIEAEINNSSITLKFDSSYNVIEPSKEILIRAAMVKNLTRIEGVEQVFIQVDGEPLTDDDGKVVKVMNRDTFIIDTQSVFDKYKKSDIKLYFINSELDALTSIRNEKLYNINSTIEKVVVEELISGPENDMLNPIMNKDTKLINIATKDKVCYVNFDKSFLLPNEHTNPEFTIYAIVNSLVELPNINKVQIQVNGSVDIMYQGIVDLNTMFERNLDIVE